MKREKEFIPYFTLQIINRINLVVIIVLFTNSSENIRLLVQIKPHTSFFLIITD